MVVNFRPVKRLKIIAPITAAEPQNLFDFIISQQQQSTTFEPFRTKVKSFISRHAREVHFPAPSSVLTWQQILFTLPTLALDIVQEDATRSRSIYCDHCRVVGWSANPVCCKRYHFIIRANSGFAEGYHKTCRECGDILQLLDARCKSCNSVITANDFEDWVYYQLADSTHLLHAVVHSNGYGHLLTVNGREGGSQLLSGCNIMNFWDMLCKSLCVRKVTVMDASKKFGLDYRLLHAIAKGQSWYGHWGYGFGAGCYAITRDAYRQAVEVLSNMSLSVFSFQGKYPPSQPQAVISFYQSLSDSKLNSLKDLISFMLSIVSESHKPRSRNNQQSTLNILGDQNSNKIQNIEEAIIKVLMTACSNASWVSHSALKGAMSKAASLDILEYCLKNIAGKGAPNGLEVKARCSPTSNVVEYRLELPNSEHSSAFNRICPPRIRIIQDLKLVYDFISNPVDVVQSFQTRDILRKSVATILDCKHFVKDYVPDKLTLKTLGSVFIWCRVELVDLPKCESLPSELIVLSSSATVADLKKQATEVFQEVYAMLKRFQADELLDFGPIDDSMTLQLLVGTYGELRVKGRCQIKHGLNMYRMERGTDKWTVDCICGTTDDDGEPMLACDSCGIWQHTRCAGISISESIPANFICEECLFIEHPDGTVTSDSDSGKAIGLARDELPSRYSTSDDGLCWA